MCEYMTQGRVPHGYTTLKGELHENVFPVMRHEVHVIPRCTFAESRVFNIPRLVHLQGILAFAALQTRCGGWKIKWIWQVKPVRCTYIDNPNSREVSTKPHRPPSCKSMNPRMHYYAQYKNRPMQDSPIVLQSAAVRIRIRRPRPT